MNDSTGLRSVTSLSTPRMRCESRLNNRATRLLNTRPNKKQKRASTLPRPFSFVCRACSIAWRCKSSSQRDGREVIAKRKGRVARRGLKEARSKHVSRWTRTGFEAGGVRASWPMAAKPISIKSAACKSGGCAWKASELTSGDLLHVTEA